MAVLELDPLPGSTGPPPKTYLELDPLPAPKNYLELDPETAPPMASIFGDPSIPAMPLSSMAAGATAEPAPAPPGLSLSAVLAAPPPPVVPGPDVALHQLQQPTPPPAAPEFTDPMSGSPMTLMDPPGTGFAGGLAAGHKEMVRQGMRTLQGEAFTPDPNAPEPPKDPGFGYELGHGLAYSTPTLAAGLAGGAAGGAIGSAVPVVGTGLGALVGSGLGVALTSVAQDLAPTYAAAIQRGMSHEDAVDYAWKHAAATGTLSGVASTIPGGKTILGRILFQGFVAQPAGGAAVRAGVPAIMGEPLPSAGEFVRGAGQDVIMGLGFGAGHAGAREVIQAVRPPPEPVVPATSPIDIIARERLAPPQPDQPVSVPEAPVVEPPAPAPPTPGMTATMPEQPGVPAAAPVLPAPVPGQRVAPRLPEVPAAEPSAPAPGERQEPPPIRTEPEPAPPVAPPTEARAEAPAVEAPAVARPAEGAPLPLEPAPARAATEPEPRAPVEPVPPSPQAEPSVPPTEPRVTTEPDHLDPTRYVAKNEAGEVIGKGATAEEATADAQARGGKVYPAEPAAAEAAPVTTLHPREDYRTVVGGTYSLSPQDKTTLATAVERAVAERGAVTFEDLPREITDKLGTDQLAGLKAHLGNPDLVLDVLRGDTSRVAPSAATRPAEAPAAEPAARAPADYLKLDPNIRAEEYVRRLSELRDNKPRPINKLWRNPETAPPEQVEAARAALRAWNREYRVVARNQKLAETRDNEAFRARGVERLQEQETGAKVAGEPPLEDRGLVPGPAEAPGTSGPRVLSDATGNKSGVISGEPGRATTQLEKITASRDALAAKPNKTAADRTRLDRLNTQVERLTTAEERRAGRNQPVSGAPRPRSQDFLDYKFNNGVSVYRSVFEQAGHDPDLATSRPVAWQNEVLQRHMMSTFGFKDVSLAKGTPVDDYVRREAMLDSTRAIQDLMGTLGLPNEAASLNGRLTLVYDPEGKVNYFGRYSLTEGEIRLAGRGNSFGHEWTHAVDHLLAERATGNQGLTNDLLTRYARKDQLDPRDGVQGAFARVLNTLYYDKAAQALREMHLMAESRKVDAQGNPTKGALVAQRQLDALERGNLRLRIQPSEFRAAAGTQGNRAYFQDPAELLARAHESYLARQMKNQGLDPRGAVMPDEAYLKESERLLKALYPKAEDQARIFDAFKVLHDEMRNADVLSQGKPGAAFPNLGISDPRHYPPSLLRQPGAQSTKQEHARWTARVNRLLNDQLFERSRPQGPLGWGTRVADLGRGMTWSDGGLMQVQIDRAPAGVRPFLQELRDLVTTDPGSGRYNPEFLEERSRFVATDFMRRFTRIIQNGGYDHPTKMPAEDNLMLRHILTTGDDKAFPPDPTNPNQTKPIPDHIKQIAGNLRGLLNEAWQMAHNAGIDVGYAKSGYFPRQYDKQLVYSNPDGFRTAAGKVYGVMFDQELGAPGSDPQALFEKWSGLSKAYKAGADPDLAPMMRELNKNLREQRGIEENPKPTPADQARLAQLKAEATQLAGDAHPLLRDHISGKEAESFWQRMANPDIHNFDSEGFSARHFSGRTLPPEADTIMRDFMVTSVNDAIPHYFESVARRVADAERFGPKGERAEALLQKALDAGLHPEELQKFKTSLNRVRGVNQPGREAAYSTVSNLAHAYGGVVLMDRSAWSSLSEPINAGLVTGYHSLGPRIIANQFAQGFGQLFRRASARERAETAELLGVINSAQTDAIIASRMGRDYADTPRIAKFMQGFYRLTGLTQLTNSQRIANVAGAHWFLTKLAKSYTNQADGFGARFGKEKAERWFSELGVPEELHGDFAKWVQDQQGQVPTSAKLLADDMAPVYGLAVRRITNRVIQNPFKVDRAAHADMPGVGLAFQLMSFNYAYQKNVLEPAFKSVHTAYHFGKEDALNQGFSSAAARARGLTTAAGTTANMAAAAGAVVAVGFLTTAMREAVFSPDKWEEHDEKGDTGSWLANLAMQRSGLNGTLDPLIQVVTNLKYFTDVQSLLGGGSVAWVGKNMTDLVMGVFGEKGETNARLYQGWRGALNLGGVPLAAFILNAVGSVNPVMRLAAGAALQLGTSSEMVSRITAAIAGPKGAKPAEADGGKLGGLGDLKGLEGMGGLDAETKKTGGGEGGGGLIPWALLDDFISPATRVAAPLLNVIPGPLKALGATAGVGAGLLSAYNAGSPYRGQPAPEKRAH